MVRLLCGPHVLCLCASSSLFPLLELILKIMPNVRELSGALRLKTPVLLGNDPTTSSENYLVLAVRAIFGFVSPFWLL